MKKVILFFMTTLLVNSAIAQEYRTEQAILADLKVYKTSDAFLGNEHAAEILMKVNSAVEYAVVNDVSIEVLKEILRVSSITLRNDPSVAAATILVPLFKKNPSTFKEALKVLSPRVGKDLLKAVRSALFDQEFGNG